MNLFCYRNSNNTYSLFLSVWELFFANDSSPPLQSFGHIRSCSLSQSVSVSVGSCCSGFPPPSLTHTLSTHPLPSSSFPWGWCDAIVWEKGYIVVVSAMLCFGFLVTTTRVAELRKKVNEGQGTTYCIHTLLTSWVSYYFPPSSSTSSFWLWTCVCVRFRVCSWYIGYCIWHIQYPPLLNIAIFCN